MSFRNGCGQHKREVLRTLVLYRVLTNKKCRSEWVHPLNQARACDGEHLKVDRMYREFPEKFFQYTRMSPQVFDKLLAMVEPIIKKQNTSYRESIPARVRMYVTLRYLATGDSINTIATSFSMGKSTVWSIIQDCLDAIWETVGKAYVKWPKNDEWNTIMDEFQTKWQFPNLLGAIDGKHVTIKRPPNTGSLYLNYKGTFSIVLMAICDANYNFTFVDVGGFGKQSDGGVLANSVLGPLLTEGTAGLPPPQTLPSSGEELPCVFVGDEAFALTPYMMRPFSGKDLNDIRRIYNYRLSRARRCIENAFGIMASRFRIFSRVLPSHPETAQRIVQAAVALHNFIKKEEEMLPPQNRFYCPPGYGDSGDDANGLWRRGQTATSFFDFQGTTIPAQERMSKDIRNKFADYFSNEGAVPWQQARANIT